jgi:large subunit ribosomal protein L6
VERFGVIFGSRKGIHMSRLGKLPVRIPKGVEVSLLANVLHVTGPKGNIQQALMKGIELEITDQEVRVMAAEKNGNFQGLYRSLIYNMVFGVVEGFVKTLKMIGVGYRAEVKGDKLDVQVGFSHPTILDIPEGIQVHVEKTTTIFVSGVDKQQVGQFAATIRSLRPPEPYKGKGIRYEGEYVRKKAGKSAKAK